MQPVGTKGPYSVRLDLVSVSRELPERIRVGPGRTASLALPSAMGGGYTWSILESPNEGIAEARIKVGRPPAQPTSNPTATVAPETLVITGLALGQTSVKISQSRSWAKQDPLVDHTIVVNVDEDVEGAQR